MIPPVNRVAPHKVVITESNRPCYLSKKTCQVFADTFQSALTEETPPSTVKARPILISRGIFATIVQSFAKIVLGKSAYKEIRCELKKKLELDLVEILSKESITKEDLVGVTHKEIAKAHVLLKKTALDALNGWEALDISGGEVREKSVYTTSERTLDKTPHLTNIYVKRSDSGRVTITCGVIDTKQKADEFIKAIEWIQKKWPDQKIRISMHQLNSMGVGPGVVVSEQTLVKRQHELVRYINYKLGGHVVSHMNRCLNGFTQIKGEDAKSHAINQEGLAIQALWLKERCSQMQIPELSTVADTLSAIQEQETKLSELLEKNPEIDKQLDAINQKLSALILDDLFDLGLKTEEEKIRYENLMSEKETLEKKNREIKACKSAINAFEKDLYIQNKKLYEQLEHMPNKPIEMQLFTKILGSQTGTLKLTATQELAYMFLLDKALGVITEINCKSGLDRTGFSRALQAALDKRDIQEAMELVDGFEKKETPEANALRDDIGKELEDVAIPITQRSTGLKGLKWHWGLSSFNPFQANPHPLYWIPEKYVDKAKDGTRRPPSAPGVLCGLSSKRGG